MSKEDGSDQMAGVEGGGKSRGGGLAIEFTIKIGAASTLEFVSESVSSFGYSPSELKGGAVRVGKLIHSEDLESVTQALARAYHGGEAEAAMSFRILAKSGEPRRVSARVALERDASGRVTRYRGTLVEEGGCGAHGAPGGATASGAGPSPQRTSRPRSRTR